MIGSPSPPLGLWDLAAGRFIRGWGAIFGVDFLQFPLLTQWCCHVCQRFLCRQRKYQMSLFQLGEVLPNTLEALVLFFHGIFVCLCGHCQFAAILLQDASARCQALVGGDSLELFDVDLGERQWILKPEGQVQAAIEVEWSNWPGKKDDKIYRCFFCRHSPW